VPQNHASTRAFLFIENKSDVGKQRVFSCDYFGVDSSTSNVVFWDFRPHQEQSVVGAKNLLPTDSSFSHSLSLLWEAIYK
jgi:hypothetical protein